MHDPIAININFDSLNEHFGFPNNFRDPSFFEVFDRFLNFSEKFNFKYSIFIIGKDLENTEIKARVKDWSQQGHEVGNHSYTHPMNIGVLSEKAIEYEILKSHELILNCTGVEPRGFICPGWSLSKNVIKTLINYNYLYDTSLFPSFLMYLAVIKNAFNHIASREKLFKILSRKDYLYPWTKPKSAFFADENFEVVTAESTSKKIIVLPLPTMNWHTPSIWHTLIFIFGSGYGKKCIDKYLKCSQFFYYLIHPADLMDLSDLKSIDHTIERMETSLATKNLYLNEVFEMIQASQRPIVTMSQLANNFAAQMKSQS